MGRSRIAISMFAISSVIVALGLGLHLLAYPNWLIKGGKDLSAAWQRCAVARWSDRRHCHWYPANLPETLTSIPHQQRGNVIEYRRAFVAPKFCLATGHGCSLVLGGVYQEANVEVNGHSVGLHYTKSDLYPAIFDIPKTLLMPNGQSNALRITVRSSIGSFSGVDEGPVGIYSYSKSKFIFFGMFAERVIAPLLSAGICLVFALVALFWMLSRNGRPSMLNQYTVYCLTAAAFLLNSTRFPREFMTHGAGDALNYLLRTVMDLGLLELVTSYFRLGGKAIRVLEKIYFLAIVLFLFLLTLNIFGGVNTKILNSVYLPTGLLGLREGTPVYELACLFSPLFFLPAIIGLVQSLKLIGRQNESWIILGMFLVVAPMHLLDVCTFLGIIGRTHEIYYMRIYPPFIALAFAHSIWMSWIEKERRTEATLKLGQIAASVAHDLKSPITALRVLSQSFSSDENQNALLSAAIGRIEGISGGLLNQYRSAQVAMDDSSFSERAVFLNAVLIEQVSIHKMIRGGEIDFSFLGSPDEIVWHGDEVHLGRAMDNLIRNAVDSTRCRSHRLIRVEVQRVRRTAIIRVIDNGTGMTDQLLRRLNSGEFGESRKHDGHGLGLISVWDFVERHRGKLKFSTSEGPGTVVQICLPLMGRS